MFKIVTNKSLKIFIVIICITYKQIYRFLDTLVLLTSGINNRLIPVSYTHLDVYKRQTEWHMVYVSLSCTIINFGYFMCTAMHTTILTKSRVAHFITSYLRYNVGNQCVIASDQLHGLP